MEDKILLFIPAYNCENQIGRVLGQINNEVLKYLSEIIIVNNRSTDNTENKVKEYISNSSYNIFKLLRNHDNYGLGASHKVAFQYAVLNNFDYVVVLHGDDQGDINDLLYLLKSKTYKKYDCCLGARFMKKSKLLGYSKFRTFGNNVYNMLFSLIVKQRIYDLGSGLNIYNAAMLKNEFYLKFPDKLTFNYCMILAMDYYKHTSYFFPISWREEDQVSNVKMVSQAINVLKMLGNYGFNKSKFIKSELREKRHEAYSYKVIFESETTYE